MWVLIIVLSLYFIGRHIKSRLVGKIAQNYVYKILIINFNIVFMWLYIYKPVMEWTDIK